MKITFTGTKDYEAYDAALQWCDAHGVSYGALQADAPTGLLVGDVDIAKWRNLNAKERAALAGTLNAPGRTYRSGPVLLEIKDECVTAEWPA